MKNLFRVVVRQTFHGTRIPFKRELIEV